MLESGQACAVNQLLHQSSKTIPENKFNISHYLSFATTCFDSVTSGNESRTLFDCSTHHLSVFYPKRSDTSGKRLDGDFLKVHGHFECFTSRKEFILLKQTRMT
ncbi:hypothetical protein QVD99_000098 [Batrachochytrium dendrobatidis]|nr:hypothetical protein QVD99_000098 [Batrachochytrium dendrobatidis]